MAIIIQDEPTLPLKCKCGKTMAVLAGTPMGPFNRTSLSYPVHVAFCHYCGRLCDWVKGIWRPRSRRVRAEGHPFYRELNKYLRKLNRWNRYTATLADYPEHVIDVARRFGIKLLLYPLPLEELPPEVHP